MSAPKFDPMLWLDDSQILAKQTAPIEYLIDGILPVGTVGDIFGSPGAGKTSLLMSLVVHIAALRTEWFGRKMSTVGPVLMIGGEKSQTSVWQRDFHRALIGTNITQKELGGRIKIQPTDNSALWGWQRTRWLGTKAYDDVLKMSSHIKPVLIIIDTLSRGALGSNGIDITQQHLLALKLEQLQREASVAAGQDVTILTVSHTNQVSTKGRLIERLDWTSRSGSSGLPGYLRWMMGVTSVSAGVGCKTCELNSKDIDPESKYFAVSVSKASEMPNPLWRPSYPAIFQMHPGGNITLYSDADIAYVEPPTSLNETPAVVYPESWMINSPGVNDDFY
ncbi:MAG: hypothetical protein B7X29_02465 [Halothiobacillus sp. 13-55-115]|jgi:hypothetical protein|nr:MAG: hypothetical protein B7X29_02465 [Halothiobacillus sp. 13-55-115]